MASCGRSACVSENIDLSMSHMNTRQLDDIVHNFNVSTAFSFVK